MDTRTFLSRVVAWPEPGSGYVNLHWHLPGGPFKGVAVENIDAFMRELGKAREYNANLYFCTSQQREAKPNGSGFVAVRNRLNATAMKAVWFDIDVGEGKSYATTKEALDALKKFIEATKIPPPSAVVASGSGGIHVWWISNHVLVPALWQHYADSLRALAESHGLHIDGPCTSDGARVLRIPSTLNYKWDPPRPVTLLGLGKDYNFSEVFTSAPVPANVPRRLLPSIPARFAGRVATITVKDEDLQKRPPMSFGELAACLNRIPNDKENWERWNTIGMRIFAACDGEDYGLQAWQAWSDKLETRGTDACDARWNTYHTCPPTKTGSGALVNEVRRLTGDDKWLPVKRVAPKLPALPTEFSDEALQNILGHGYRVTDGRIYVQLASKKKRSKDGDDDDDDGDDLYEPLVKSQMVALPRPQAPPGEGLHFTIQKDIKRRCEIFIPLDEWMPSRVFTTVSERGLLVNFSQTSATRLSNMFTSILGTMNALASPPAPMEMGWEMNEDGSEVPIAFVYGNTRFTDKGEKQKILIENADMRAQYTPVGRREAWDRATKLVFDQKRPGLELILASYLAAPLMKLLGSTGATLSIYSNGSGAHKSTASQIGGAIWGHPKRTRESVGSSFKGTIKRMMDVRHLPVSWDDISEDKHLQSCVEIALLGQQGSGGTKLTQNRDYFDGGSWQTTFLILSNGSVIDYVAAKQPNNSAQIARIFEIEIEKQVGMDKGMIKGGEADMLVDALQNNYGHVGMQYAELLAVNAESIRELAQKERSDFEDRMVEFDIPRDSGDRLWLAMCASLLTAAKFGPQMGLFFDYAGIHTLLTIAYRRNCKRRQEEALEGGAKDNTQLAITGFLNDAKAANALWSTTSAKKGGNERDKIEVLAPPLRGQTLFVHFITLEREIRISMKAFNAAMKAEKRSASVVRRGLEKHFAADTEHRYILGAGSEFGGTPEKVIVIPVPEGSIFETILFAHGVERNVNPLA